MRMLALISAGRGSGVFFGRKSWPCGKSGVRKRLPTLCTHGLAGADSSAVDEAGKYASDGI